MNENNNKREFKDLLEKYNDHIDFIDYPGGAGGEWLSTTISQSSPDYTIVQNIEKEGNNNRWSYQDPLDGFFVKISKQNQKNKKRYISYNDLANDWIRYYPSEKRQNKILSSFKKQIEFGKRILVRSHGSFIGFDKLFPNSKQVSLIPHTFDWWIYTRLLCLIKILSAEYSDDEKAQKFIKESWEFEKNIRPNDTTIPEYLKYYNWLKQIKLPLRGFSVIVLLNYKDYDINPFDYDPNEFNNINTLLKLKPIRELINIDKDDFRNIRRYMKVQFRYENIAYIPVTIEELVNGEKIPKIFNCDTEYVKEKMAEWHNKNMELIYKLEESIGRLIINL